MSDLPRRKGFRGDRGGACRRGLPVRRRGHQRISFRSPVAASRLFRSRAGERNHPQFPCRRSAAGNLAPGGARRSVRWNDFEGQGKLVVVADRRARRATLRLLGPCRDRALGRRMAHRSGDKISLGIDDAAQSPEGRRSHDVRPTRCGNDLPADARGRGRKKATEGRGSLRRHSRLPAHAGRRLFASDNSRGRRPDGSLTACCRPEKRPGSWD